MVDDSCASSPTVQNPVPAALENSKLPGVPPRSPNLQPSPSHADLMTEYLADMGYSPTSPPLNFLATQSKQEPPFSANMVDSMQHQHQVRDPFTEQGAYDDTMGLGRIVSPTTVDWNVAEDSLVADDGGLERGRGLAR